jgi:hypothetical protein
MGEPLLAGGNQAIVEVALTQVGNQADNLLELVRLNSRVDWCDLLCIMVC